MSYGFHGDEPIIQADRDRADMARADYMADMDRDDGTELLASQRRIKSVLDCLSGLTEEPVMHTLLDVKHRFGLSSKEMETVIHRWVVAAPAPRGESYVDELRTAGGGMSEQDDQEFRELVGRIRVIEPEAALWLDSAAKPLTCLFSHTGALSGVMLWDETPQGHDYWMTIDDRINVKQKVSEYDCIKQQRDELLAALEQLMQLESRGRVMPIGAEWDAARAAIAKATS